MELRHHLSSWKLYVVINGYEYSVAAFRIIFQANGLNTAQLQLAVGNNPNNLAAQSFNMVRGQAASIYIGEVDDESGSLSDGEIFKGFLYDFFIDGVSYGQFSFSILLRGTLSYLASGTLQNSGIIPSSYLSSDVQHFASWADSTGTLADVATGQIDPSIAYSNGFLTALKLSMVPIANGLDNTPNPITAQIRTLFGDETNKPAAYILGGASGDVAVGSTTFTNGYPTGADGSGTGLFFRNSDVTHADWLCNGTCVTLSNHMRSDWRYASFYDKLLSIGSGLMFSVVETPGTFWCVPHIPFFHSNSVRKTITADQYSALNIRNDAKVPNVSGCVLLNTDNTQAVGTGTSIIRATYKRIPVTDNISGSTYNPGQVIVTSVPPLLTMSPVNGGTSLAKVTTSQDLTGSIPTTTANELAKLATFTAAYKPYSVVVSCPFIRSDIAPLTAVRVDLPESAEIGGATASPAMYGTVNSVVLAGDASQQFASTQIEVSYVRSYQQQNREINAAYNGHPLWTQNWYGCDLYGDDVHTGF